MTNACIFVDGENFRHSITAVFQDQFDHREYLPKQARWQDFFDWLATHAAGLDCQRMRTYWYVLEHVDFFPYRIPRADKEADELRITLSKHRPYQTELKNLSRENAKRRMAEMAVTLRDRQQAFSKRFAGWHAIQDGIANSHRAVEFRRAGAMRYNLFTKKMGQEKAVDVMLATDMIMLRDIYDCAILVSGDQDYVPAVKRIKDAGKIVINVAFEGARAFPILMESKGDSQKG